MTDSYAIPQQQLPDISQFNYQTNVDPTSSLAENLQDDVNNKATVFKAIIERENEKERFKQQFPEELWRLTEQGIRIAQAVQEETRTREIIDAWNTSDEEYNTRFKDHNGVKYETYLEYVQATEAGIPEQTALAGIAAESGDVDALRTIQEPREALSQANRVMAQGVLDYPQFVAMASSSLQVQIPGTDRWITLDGSDATGGPQSSDEYWYVQEAIRSAYLKQFIGSEDQPVSNHLIRHKLYPGMSEFEEQQFGTWNQNMITAMQTNAAESQKIEFYDKITTGENVGEVFQQEVINRLALPSVRGDRGVARRMVTDLIIDGIKEGYITEEHVDALLNYSIEAFDGSTQTFKDYWKPEARQIEAALAAHLRQQYLDRDATERGRVDKWITEQLNPYIERSEKGGEIITLEEAEQLRQAFIKEFPMTPIPDRLNKIPTLQYQESSAILAELKHKVHVRREALTSEDLWGITDTTIRKEAELLLEDSKILWNPASIREMEAAVGQLMNSPGYAWASADINPGAAFWLEERIAQDLRENYAAERGQGRKDHAGAWAAAQQTTLQKLEANLFGTENTWMLGQSKTVKIATEVAQTIDAIINDDTLVNSSVRIPGETDYNLASAAAYLQSRNTGQIIQIPEYWSQAGANYKGYGDNLGGVENYMIKRLTSLGLIEDGTVLTDFDEALKNVPGTVQSALTTNAPGASTIQAVLEADEVEWLMTTLNNKRDWNAITAPSGVTSELPRPLTEMTIREVVGLVGEGYTNIGGFNMTPVGLKETLQFLPDQFFNLDQQFDENTQKFLLLARLRSNAIRRNSLSGIDPYLSQVFAINPAKAEEISKDLEITSMADLHNLLPELAEAELGQ